MRAGIAALGDVDAAVITARRPAADHAAGDRRRSLDADLDVVRRGARDLRRQPGPSRCCSGAGCSTRAGELEGDAGFRELLEGARSADVEVGDLGDPTDVDTPEELAAL